MTREEIDEFVTNATPQEILLPDNLDEGFVGVDTESDTPRAVYSIERCIKQLSEDMTLDEATEYFWYNVPHLHLHSRRRKPLLAERQGRV